MKKIHHQEEKAVVLVLAGEESVPVAKPDRRGRAIADSESGRWGGGCWDGWGCRSA